MLQEMRKTIPFLFVLILLAVTVSGCYDQPTDTSSAKTESESTKSDASAKSDSTAQKATQANSTGTTKTTTPSKSASNTQKTGSGKVLLFDIAHKEIFNPDDMKEMGCSAMRDLFVSKGYEVNVNDKAFTDESLRNAEAVAIAGPMTVLTGDEVAAMKRYLEAGGNLLVTVHVSYFVSELTTNVGMQLSNGVLVQRSETFENSPKNFIARGVTAHPVMKGVSGVAVRASWALQPLPGNAYDAKTIVSTSPDSWVDLTANDMYDVQEPRGAYGIIGVSTVGKGKVVIIGDDAVFTNMTIGMANNRTLCENIAEWFDS